MSEEHTTSNTSSNDKIYLGIIAVLVLILIYLFMSQPTAKPQSAAAPKPAPAAKKATPPAPASAPVIEGWTQFPMADISKQWLYENNIRTIIFLDDKLQARVGNKDGIEAKVCARTTDGGTGVTGECAKIKESTTTRATSIFVKILEASPGWCWTYVSGNLIYYQC